MGWARFKALVIQHWALIFFITALLVSIFLIPPAHASTVNLHSDPVGFGISGTSFGSSNVCFAFGFYPGVSGNVDHGRVYGHKSSGGDMDIAIYSQIPAGTPPTLLSSGSATFGTSNAWVDFDLTPFSISTTTARLFFALGKSGTDTFSSDVAGNYTIGQSSGEYASKSSDCPSGNFDGTSGGYPSYTPWPVELSGAPAPSDSISITYPTNGSTVAVLSFWGVDYKAATSTTYQAYVSPFYTIEITAGNTSSTFQGTLVGRKDLEITASGSTTSTQVIAVQGFIPGITYYAQGTLIFHAAWGDSGLLVATSSVISFTVSTTTFPGTFPSSTNPFPTSTISTSNVCDPNAFFLIYGICRLFVPQASDFVIFNVMKTYVQNKPPFGYIGLTITALNNLGTASSTVQFPDLSGFVFVFDPIRTGLNSLFWVLFVFWLLSKFRNIEL